MSRVLLLCPPGHCQAAVHPMLAGAGGVEKGFQVAQSSDRDF